MKTFLCSLAVTAVLVSGSAIAQQPTSESQSPQAGQSQPSQPSAAAQPSGGQQQVLVDAGSIIGSTVRSADGQDIGKVTGLMVEPREGRIRTVVVNMGGTLGVGGKSVSLPWESVKVGQDRGNLVVTPQQGTLEQAPSASPRSDQGSSGRK
jgi:sporulation protein YlmC with PRC-barrel domain